MSTKSVAQKLQIKPGMTVWSSHEHRLDLLGALPDGVRVVDRPAHAQAAVVFGDDAASVRAIFSEHADALGEAQALWVAYPKGNHTDVNRDTLWPLLAEHGMRPIGQVALDERWSALRFRVLRAGETFKGGAKS